MNKHCLRAFALVIAFLGLPSALRAGDAAAVTAPPFAMPEQYQVEEKVTSPQGAMTMNVFRDGEKTRTDMDNQGRKVSMIGRPDLKLTYMLMHEQKMQITRPYEPSQFANPAREQTATWKKTGTDKINEIDYDTYDLTTAAKEVWKVWVNPKDQTLLKMVNDAKKTAMEFDHWKLAKPDAAVFEPPKDYTDPMAGHAPPNGPGGPGGAPGGPPRGPGAAGGPPAGPNGAPPGGARGGPGAQNGPPPGAGGPAGPGTLPPARPPGSGPGAGPQTPPPGAPPAPPAR